MQFSTIILSILSLSITSILAAPVAVPNPNAVAEPQPGRTYISYAALGADRVPPSGTGKPANGYNRGCTKEERCARDTGK